MKTEIYPGEENN